MRYRVEKYETQRVSMTTGVSPKRQIRYRIVRVSDGRVMETAIENKKLAESRMSYL